MAIYIILYSLVLLLYLYTETTGNMKLRAPNKIILALGFLIPSYIFFFTNARFDYKSYEVLLLFGLLFAFIGDVTLLFDFKTGGYFFMAGNIIFSTFQFIHLIDNGIPFSTFFYIFIAYIVFMGLIILGAKAWKRFNAGSMFAPIMAYLGSITLSGFMAIANLIYLSSITTVLLFSIGILLFMISDFFLMIRKFAIRHNNIMLRMNSLTYFGGMLLIAVSMFF